MNMENRMPLTALEACTLMAREAVSLLDGSAETMNSAAAFRSTLALISATQDLGDGGVLLAWVDTQLDSARQFAETGRWSGDLVQLDTPLPLPDPAMQIEAACTILQIAAQRQRTPEQWQDALNMVRMLTEMDALEDMVLTGYVPSGGFLTTTDLRDQLERVQAALWDNRQEQKGVEMEQI